MIQLRSTKACKCTSCTAAALVLGPANVPPCPSAVPLLATSHALKPVQAPGWSPPPACHGPLSAPHPSKTAHQAFVLPSPLTSSLVARSRSGPILLRYRLPGTCRNCTRISARRECSALPALSRKGTPSQRALLMNMATDANVGHRLRQVHGSGLRDDHAGSSRPGVGGAMDACAAEPVAAALSESMLLQGAAVGTRGEAMQAASIGTAACGAASSCLGRLDPGC